MSRRGPCVKCGLDERDKYEDCRPCKVTANKKWRSQNRARCVGYTKKWEANNKDRPRWETTNPVGASRKYRRRNLRRRGMTEADYNSLLAKQGGRCAVCKTDTPTGKGGRLGRFFHVDHDHETGNVRGLLCTGCNTGNRITDNPDLLAEKIIYLNFHGRLLSSNMATILNCILNERVAA